jgi:hypothetical protein
MCQAEKWLIMRDGTLQSPNIYDGTSVFAASTLPNPDPIGPGRQMEYSKGAVYDTAMMAARSCGMTDLFRERHPELRDAVCIRLQT